MRDKVDSKTLYFLFIQIFIFILSIIITISKTDLRTISILSFIVLIWNVVSWIKITHKIFTPYILFIFAIYIFNFGQLLIWYIDSFNSNIEFIIFTRLSSQDLVSASKFALIGFVLFHLGGLLYLLFAKKNFSVNIKLENNEDLVLRKIYKLGVVLLIISFIPAFIYDFTLMKASINGGYIFARANKIQYGIWSDMYRLFKASLIILVIGLNKEKKKASLIVFVSIVYSTLRMILFGERGFEIIFIFVLLWLYHTLIKPFNTNKRSVIKLIILIIILTILMTFIVDIRTISKNNLDIVSYLKMAIENNPIKRQLIEFGSTLISLGLTMHYIPSHTSYFYGSTYLYSFLTVLPNIGGFLNPILKNIKIGTILQRYYSGALGGSYLAELYLNFSWFGLLGSALFGLYIAKIDYQIYLSIIKKRYISIVNYSNLITILLWFVRSSFSEIPRKIEVIIVFPMLIFFLMNNFVLKHKVVI